MENEKWRHPGVSVDLTNRPRKREGIEDTRTYRWISTYIGKSKGSLYTLEKFQGIRKDEEVSKDNSRIGLRTNRVDVRVGIRRHYNGLLVITKVSQDLRVTGTRQGGELRVNLVYRCCGTLISKRSIDVQPCFIADTTPYN